MKEIVLVNEKDEETGSMEKMEAHRQALLHRAFSVFIFNNEGALLLQKRAAGKYHSAGLWTNTCCSHPEPGEAVEMAAERRLKEEMGFSAKLDKAFDFIYKAPFDNGLTEHEFDHVFVGNYDGEVKADPNEVSAIRYATLEEIEEALQQEPEAYTAWFHIAFPKLLAWMRE